MDNEVDWSKLPTDLWPKIGKCLDNRTDVLRFRSVCETFRSSIIPSLPNSASFPMKVPQPLNPATDALVRETTIYVIEPTDGTSKLEPLAPSSKGWLVKIGKSKKHRFTLMSPISDSKILQPLRTSASIMWNLLDFRVIELCKSYTMHCKGRYSPPVTKVVFFPNSPWVDVKNSMACCIFAEGMLGFMKHGDEKWTLVDETNFFYDDIIVFKGQFYVTDKLGTISWVDTSSMKLIQFSPLLYGFGYKKYLVESCGSLYVVDRLFEGDRYIRRNYVGSGDVVVRVDREAAMECFKVYKLDEEWGTWVDVKNLRDRVFILATGCNFSVSANELTGYQRNCIYFTDSHRVRGYNLDDRSIIFHEFDPCIDKSLASRDPSKRVGPHFEIQTII